MKRSLELKNTINLTVLILIIFLFSGFLSIDKMRYSKEKKAFEKSINSVKEEILKKSTFTQQEYNTLDREVVFGGWLLDISVIASKVKETNDFNKVWMPKMLKEMGIIYKTSMRLASQMKDTSSADNYIKFSTYMLLASRCKDGGEMIIGRFWSTYERMDVFTQLFGEPTPALTE